MRPAARQNPRFFIKAQNRFAGLLAAPVGDFGFDIPPEAMPEGVWRDTALSNSPPSADRCRTTKRRDNSFHFMSCGIEKLLPTILPKNPRMAALRFQHEIAHEDRYIQFLKNRGVTVFAPWVFRLKRVAHLLNQNISASLFWEGRTPASILARLRLQKDGAPIKSALTAYYRMVKEARGRHVARRRSPMLTRGKHKPAKENLPLSSKGRVLLQAIITYCRLNKVDAGQPATYPTYGELYRVVAGDSSVVIHAGRHLRREGLDDLNEWTHRNPRVPKITGVIVNKSSKRPHENFFVSHGKTPFRDDNWWRNEVRKSLTFDWRPYLATLPLKVIYRDFGEAPDDKVVELQQFARRVRKGQQKFRRRLLSLYDSQCAISGWAPEEVLDAAHINEHSKSGINHSENGILIRADLHALMDANLLRINPGTLKVVIDPALRKTPYWTYHGLKVRQRSDRSQISHAYLLARFGQRQHAERPLSELDWKHGQVARWLRPA